MKKLTKKNRWTLILIMLFCGAGVWILTAPKKLIKADTKVSQIIFRYANETDSGFTTIGYLLDEDSINEFIRFSDNYKYLKSNALIKGTASYPDYPPIWITVHYTNGNMEGYISYPNGSLVLLNYNVSAPKLGHIGMISSKKGVLFYNELVSRFVTLEY